MEKEGKIMEITRFLIGGFPKCGCSTLSNYFYQHPQIAVPEKYNERYEASILDRGQSEDNEENGIKAKYIEPKEFPGYFGTEYDLFKKKINKYHESNSEVKMVVIMRDPIRRAQSCYWHRMITSGISISFEKALRTPKERDILEDGEYKKFVKWLDKFDPFYMISEELWENKKKILGELYNFLGVDYYEPEEKRKNKSGEPRIKFISQLTTGEKRIPIITEYFPEVLPILNKGINIFNVKDTYPPLDEKTKSFLVKHYKEKNEGLGEIIGKDLSEWWEWW